MTAAPFAMIVVALAGLFVFGGFVALVALLVARADTGTAPSSEDGPAQPPPG